MWKVKHLNERLMDVRRISIAFLQCFSLSMMTIPILQYHILGSNSRPFVTLGLLSFYFQILFLVWFFLIHLILEFIHARKNKFSYYQHFVNNKIIFWSWYPLVIFVVLCLFIFFLKHLKN